MFYSSQKNTKIGVLSTLFYTGNFAPRKTIKINEYET